MARLTESFIRAVTGKHAPSRQQVVVNAAQHYTESKRATILPVHPVGHDYSEILIRADCDAGVPTEGGLAACVHTWVSLLVVTPRRGQHIGMVHVPQCRVTVRGARDLGVCVRRSGVADSMDRWVALLAVACDGAYATAAARVI